MRKRWYFTLMLAAALIFSMGPSSLGFSSTAITDQNNHQLLHLKWQTFDPLYDSIDIPRNLQISHIGNLYWIVQLNDPIVEVWERDLLESTGIELIEYLPDGAYVAEIQPSVLSAVQNLDIVRWIGAYQPAFKIDESLQDCKGSADIIVQVFGGEDSISSVTSAINRLGGTINEIIEETNTIHARIDTRDIETLAHHEQVKYLEKEFEKVQFMNIMRDLTGATTMHLNGFDGSGIVGEVKDAGYDNSHYEFDGQILAEDGSVVHDKHGTCTFGIVFAKGVSATAKGMLPLGDGVFCDWNVARYTSIENLKNNWGGVFQSNSWGTSNMVGAYTSNSQSNDQAVRDLDVSMVWAAGNNWLWYYTCTDDSSAKNVICVGGINHYNTASRSDDTYASGANRGPAADGRIKPDLCAAYDYVYTTDSLGSAGYTSGDYYSSFGGTSAATPIVAGSAGLVYEMYKENHFGNNPSGVWPHAATVKAMLINTAYQYPLSSISRYRQGWGFPDVEVIYNDPDMFIVDEEYTLTTGQTKTFPLNAQSGTPLKITLVWTDYPGTTSSSKHLINDLSLKVTDPNNNVYWGNYGLVNAQWSPQGGSEDHTNNVENVFIQNPVTGEYTVEVSAYNIPQPSQDFALIATGAGEGEPNNPPDTPTEPSPADGALDVPLSPTLTVDVNDIDGDTMTVSFYEQGGGLIGTDTVTGSGTASTTWTNADQYSTTYYWYSVADDGQDTTTSPTWSFTTEAAPPNTPPVAPTNPNPTHGATDVDINPTLSVDVSDPDGDAMDVTFYDAFDDSVIGTDYGVPSGETASVVWPGLNYLTNYSWYTKADDNRENGITQSATWTFTTKEEPPNTPPDTPTNPNPADTATNVPLSPDLSVYVSDADGDTMTVSFYEQGGTTPIGTDTVTGSGTATTTWTNADQYDTTYYWYTTSDDGTDTTTSPTWSFTTRTESEPQFFMATQDIPVQNGGTTNDYTATHASDNSYESISERESGGRPSNRYTYLEHKWTIDVTSGLSAYTFYLEAYHSENSEGDDFVFAYSTDDVTYYDMVTVTKITDDNAYQTYALPTTLSGTIYIRVLDMDQTPGNRNADTISIDHMYIEGLGTPPPNRPPDIPGDPNPADGATGVDINPTLSVYVSDPDGDTMDVTFYEQGGSPIGTHYDVPSGSRASISWPGRAYDTTYFWYAEANDGEYTETSPTWFFTTRTESPSGGMYVWDISWREKAAGPNTFLYYTVTVRVDSDNNGPDASDPVVSDATVSATLTDTSPGGTTWPHSGITDTAGQVEFGEKVGPGTYEAFVTDITHATYTYNAALDQNNPSTYTLN